MNEFGFAEHGLIGCMMGSLIIGFGWMIKWLLGHISALNTTHKQERDEFREDFDKLTQDYRSDIKQMMENKK